MVLFSFFETRSLSEEQQQASTNIELQAIHAFEEHIEAGIKAGEFAAVNARAAANAIVVLLEDWYLKPWKNYAGSELPALSDQYQHRTDYYFDELMSLAAKLLHVDDTVPHPRP